MSSLASVVGHGQNSHGATEVATCSSKCTSSGVKPNSSWQVARKSFITRLTTGWLSVRNMSRTTTFCNLTVVSPIGKWKVCVSCLHHSTNAVTNTWSMIIIPRRDTTQTCANYVWDNAFVWGPSYHMTVVSDPKDTQVISFPNGDRMVLTYRYNTLLSLGNNVIPRMPSPYK